jgi:hypothetical protein
MRRILLSGDYRVSKRRLAKELEGKSPKSQKHLHKVHVAARNRRDIWRIYKTREARDAALRDLLIAGYKYIIGWLDVHGYGLECIMRADWQRDDSPVHMDMSDR